MEINLTLLLLIFFVALGTYSFRISGLLFAKKYIKYEGRLKVFLDFLPASLLLALVIPSIVKEGLLGCFVALIIALVMYKTKSIFLSLFLAVLIISLGRSYLSLL